MSAADVFLIVAICVVAFVVLQLAGGILIGRWLGGRTRDYHNPDDNHR